MAKPAVDALLTEYRARRDFTRTAEPDHRAAETAAGGRSFVVQKHDATRLHYDFRLEWDGVLKSWAVTRGPSYDPSEKRLAVRTEDHPLAYGGFEGIIPEKEYGGGTVMLWDRGTFEPVGDFDEGLRDGKLVFRLRGERLAGEWTLVRMRPKPGEKRENWLMIKHREEGVKQPRGDVLKKHVKSVASGRTMAEIAAKGRQIEKSDLAATPRRPSPAPKRRGRARAMPRWIEPQLATLVGEAPQGEQWLAEMKYDGYRALIGVAGGKARIFTRSGLDWTDKFPGIAQAAAALDTDGTLLDGEIVAFAEDGKTSFAALQKAIKAGGRGLACFVFDLLQEEGADIRKLPLSKRKARLETLLGQGDGPLHFSTHVTGRAPELLKQLCGAGHEGVVAKRADDPYRSGRSKSWLKIKCGRAQEFVIGGFSPSSTRNRPFASVLLGVFENGDLVYKGRVGSFEGDLIEELAPRLEALARKTSPFREVPSGITRGTRFVKPEIVIEVGFAEYTSEGVVRHGVAKGIRGDRKASDVVLEIPKGSTMTSHEQRDLIAGVKLSNPQKILFAEQGVTKADLAAHYERVAQRIMPHIRKRLLSLVRCPDGAGGQCFFQKHDSKGFPDQLKRIEVAESDGERDTYLYAEDLSALVAGVQMGTLEFHIWGSRIDRLEQPDRLVFDLDPDEGLDFTDVREAAFDMRERLEAIGLKTVPMVTGGKGIHVIAPLARRAEWPAVKAFARGFAVKVSEDRPERYVANMSKAKRKGKIFVDYLRNERGSTAIAPYSTRARKGAPVATPVSWGELKALEAANAFHIADMEARMATPDPWAEAEGWTQSVTGAMLKKVGEG